MKRRVPPARRHKGFSFIEVILSIALLAFAMLGLAQLFLLGLANNARSDQISNAAFLAQQGLDELRTLTADELTAMGASPLDQMLDVNSDGQNDFRRITRLTPQGLNWTVDIWVFSVSQADIELTALLSDPKLNKVRAEISTVICR
jgi:prepilin-type N-terminal cleavage/methylation domain-containing protein